MRLGNVNLHLVSAGTRLLDGGILFGLVPQVLWAKVASPDDQNCLTFQHWCLFIETGSHRILVDTGHGEKPREKVGGTKSSVNEGTLHSGLDALATNAAEIDMVVNTHLHDGHCGGNVVYNEESGLAPAFPHATYCVQRLELADAMLPNERSRTTYSLENYACLVKAGRLRILWGDSRLTDEVRVVVTPGHTRSHQSVIIESGGRTAMLLGDVAPWPIHLERLAWVPAHDLQPMVSIETKRSLARWAVDAQVLLIFAHHPQVCAGYLHATQREDRFRLEPVYTLESG